jgi:hypothetical protein
MRKIFGTLLMAAATFFALPAEADPRWAYVYLDQLQELDSGDAVDWGGTNNDIDDIHSEGIWVNRSDTTQIIIEHPGIYLVTYSATVQVDCIDADINSADGEAQLALRLNNSLVRGSIYGTGNAFSECFFTALFANAFGQVTIDCDAEVTTCTIDTTDDFDIVQDAQTQIFGQAIVKVCDHFSILTLNNHCENDLILDNTVGTEDPADWGYNVSASVVIYRLEKNHHDD